MHGVRHRVFDRGSWPKIACVSISYRILGKTGDACQNSYDDKESVSHDFIFFCMLLTYNCYDFLLYRSSRYIRGVKHIPFHIRTSAHVGRNNWDGVYLVNERSIASVR